MKLRRATTSACRGKRLLLIACMLCALAIVSRAQNIEFTQGNVSAGLHNTIQIQLKAYPGRGASLPVNLYYSTGGLWRLGLLKTVQNGSYQAVTEAIFAEHSKAGWKSSLDLPKIEWPHQYDGYFYSGGPYNFNAYPPASAFRVRRVYIHMPDGSRHELRENDQPYQGAIDTVGTFYAVDGSRLRYDSTSATTGTLFLPDGSRYILNSSTAQFIDRNGNTLNYNAGVWTDTLGREIGAPLNPSPGQQDYYLPGMPLPYKFIWKNLADTGVLTPLPGGGTPTRKAIASEYLPNPNQEPTNPGQGNYPVSIQEASLFTRDAPDDGLNTLVVGRGQTTNELFNPVVLTEIIFPNGLSYKFSYNIHGEIDKIIYPTGAYDQYTFQAVPDISSSQVPYSQANRAVIKRELSANGLGNDLVAWNYTVEAWAPDLPANTLRITTKAPNNTYSETYQQRIMPPQHGTKQFWAFGFEDARNGAVIDERTYAPNPNGSKGPMLRRTVTEYQQTANNVPPRTGLPGDVAETAYRNLRPSKVVSLILDTAGDALAKLVTYAYNSNADYALTTGLDRTHITETHFATIDQPTAQTGPIDTLSSAAYYYPLASSSVTTYLDDSNYRDRNILGLTTSVVLNDAVGNPVTKTVMGYDSSALLSYSDLGTDWTNPGTYRGNVTITRSYLDVTTDVPLNQACPAGVCLDTHAEFDQTGNVWKVKNVRGIESVTEYSSTYKHAYSTQATTAIPDPAGVYGSNTAFTRSSTFDYTTGLPLTTTDANGQITTFSYQNDQGVNDSMNRLRKVTRPDGGWTKHSFGETLGNLFTLTETQQDAARTVKAYQYVDPLGRASRRFASEGGANYIASDTIYDQLGRVWKVSNPYRTTTLNGVAHISHTSDWTTSQYDALSRLDFVTLPDASIMDTDYQGIYTTVTDQAGRQRRQKTDALGRVVRVDEPNLSGSLGTFDAPVQPTFYQYNTQGNLIVISQGLTQAGLNPEDPNSYLQHRYFKYDALGRLTYERQVEQAGTHAASDPLTGNSAWSRKLVYDETIGGVSYKGLLTSAYDARNIRTEFRYDNLNRTWQVSYSDSTPTLNNYYDEPSTVYFNKGRLTQAITAAVGSIPATSQTYKFDLMGRVKDNQQTVGAQSYAMSYSYNLGGALTSQQYPSGRVVSYAFDNAARLSTVSSGGTTYANQFDYSTTEGLLKQMTLGSGAVEGFTYNSRLQMKSIDLTKNGAQVQHYDYKYGVYDPVNNTLDESKNTGQIARIEGFIATAKQWQQNFAYDSLGRLTSAREFRGDNPTPAGKVWVTNYEYDVFGNRYQKQAQNADNPFTPVWVESGQIALATNRFSSGVTYDDAGNVTVDSKFRNLAFQYDANNRQKQSSATDGSGAVVSVYDASGQRVATQVSGALTNVLVYDAAGRLVAEYGSSPPQANGTQYVTADHQGTPRAITSASGSVISRHDYLPFGEDVPGTVGMRSTSQGYAQPDGVRPKYAGMEDDDATGMSHTLWRQYDNLSARWTAPDPYGGSMSVVAPQSFNRYSYVENDPVNKTDPLGLALWDIGVYQTSNPEVAAIIERKVDQLHRQVTRPAFAALAGNLAAGATAGASAGQQPPQSRPVLSPELARDYEIGPDGRLSRKGGEAVVKEVVTVTAKRGFFRRLAGGLGRLLGIGGGPVGTIVHEAVIEMANPDPVGGGDADVSMSEMQFALERRDTFLNGNFTNQRLTEDTVFYRVFSDPERMQGAFLTEQYFTNSSEAIKMLALSPIFKNQATYIVSVIVPANTVIARGQAAPQQPYAKYPGGGSQVLIPNPYDPNIRWVNPTPLRK